MQTRKQLRQAAKPIWVEEKKRGGFRPGAGRKPGSGRYTATITMRLDEEDRADFDANGGTDYVRRLIREERKGSKISRQALLDWIDQREESLGEMAAELRAFLATQ